MGKASSSRKKERSKTSSSQVLLFLSLSLSLVESSFFFLAMSTEVDFILFNVLFGRWMMFEDLAVIWHVF